MASGIRLAIHRVMDDSIADALSPTESHAQHVKEAFQAARRQAESIEEGRNRG